MPYPGRRSHHLPGVKRRHHRPGYRDKDRVRKRRSRVSFRPGRGGFNVNFVRGPRGLRLRRRRRFGRHGGHGGLIRHVTAIYKLLTKKKQKKQPAAGPATTVKTPKVKPVKAVKPAKGGAGRRAPLFHGTPKPNPHRGVGRPFSSTNQPVRLRHLPVRRFAVMQTNFGQNILAPVRGPAYRTGSAGAPRPMYGVGQRNPRRRGAAAHYTTGRGRPPQYLRANRLTSRRRGH